MTAFRRNLLAVAIGAVIAAPGVYALSAAVGLPARWPGVLLCLATAHVCLVVRQCAQVRP